MCVCEHTGSTEIRECLRYPGAGDTGGYGPQEFGAGNQTVAPIWI